MPRYGAGARPPGHLAKQMPSIYLSNIDQNNPTYLPSCNHEACSSTTTHNRHNPEGITNRNNEHINRRERKKMERKDAHTDRA